MCYVDGNEFEKDDAEAAKWFRKAAEQEDALAQFFLGCCYFDGQGVTENEAEGLKWLRRAAEQGLGIAQASLASRYLEGCGVAKDEAEGLKWLGKAAEQEDALAQLMLGVMYEEGLGVTKDEAKAAEWFRKAAEQGYAAAQCALGKMYENGEGVEEDDGEAVEWFRKAAEQGHEQAKAELRRRGIPTACAEKTRREEAEEVRRATVRKNHEHGKVQLWEGGPYWAKTNIGADKPEDSGLYFWWGDTVGYRRERDAWVASDSSSRNNPPFGAGNTPTLVKDFSTLRREGWITSVGVLAPAHDAAHVHWGGNWRMPTEQELDDLDSKCEWTWGTMNGVKGYVVRGRDAYANASIFLPAVGIGYATSLRYAGSSGGYWSSVPPGNHDYASCGLGFNSDNRGVSYGRRDFMQSVRPVQGFTE